MRRRAGAQLPEIELLGGDEDGPAPGRLGPGLSRGRRGRAAASVGAVVIVSVLAWSFLASDERDDAPLPGGGERDAEQPAVRPVVERDALRPDGWQGARTAGDGSRLIISVLGRCSLRYLPEVTESDREVRIEMHATYSRGSAAGCARSAAHPRPRTVAVQLDAPLGDRRLVEAAFEREQPVFDGTELAKPTWLPGDWVLAEEGAHGYPHTWSRTWKPVDHGGLECHSTGLGFTPIHLVQSPAGTTVYGPRHPVATYDIRGHEATYHEFRGLQRLAWTEAGHDFDVLGTPCADDPLHPPEVLIAFARGLELPTDDNQRSPDKP